MKSNSLDVPATDGHGFTRLRILQKMIMCLTGTLHRTVLVVLLLANSCGKHRCNYNEILGSYKEFISVELQNLNLTDSYKTPKERDLCPSGKARRILISIYDMTQKIRCEKIGKQQLDLAKPLESMEQLIIKNCSPDYLNANTSCSTVQKMRGKKRRRNRLIRDIKALITCWQKLQSIYMFSK